MAQILNGTYEILELAGKGGMSTVFKARHIRLNKMVAVKSVRKDQPFDMQAEVDILTKLEHPNLVRVLDVFEDERLIYIVMDFIEGEDLQHVIRRVKVIPEDTLKEWFITLADILNYLHTRKPPIIYRDMKPANVILQKDGKLKLVDFGIAREYKAAASSDTTYAGSRGFAAPEQFGMAQSDGRTDIYSLGMTMYYLATGKSPLEPPYNYIPARQLNPDLSEKMERILGKCIRFNPEERYQSAAELLDDLRSDQIAETKPLLETKPKKKSFGGVIGLLLIAALFVAGFLYRDQLQSFFMHQGTIITAHGNTVDLSGIGEGSTVYQRYKGEGTVTAFSPWRNSITIRWEDGTEDTLVYPECFADDDLRFLSTGQNNTETQETEPSSSASAEDESETVSGNTSEVDALNHDIGLLISSLQTPFMQYCNGEILFQFSEDQFDGHKYFVDSVECGKNMDRQLEQIDTFIKAGKDLLIVDLADARRADEVIRKAADADIPVIFINNEPVTEDGTYEYLNKVNYEKVCFIGKDSYGAGKCQGKIVTNLSDHGDINGDGKVSYLIFRCGPYDADARMRAQGAVEALADAGIETEQVSELLVDRDKLIAQETATLALHDYGDRIEVILCSEDVLAIGASKALRMAGVNVGEDMYLLGIDAVPECIELINEGDVTATVSFDTDGIPDLVVQVVTQMITKDQYASKYYYIDCKPVE